MATGITVVLVLSAFTLLGMLFIPTLVREVNGFVEALPGYVDDIIKGGAGSASLSGSTR